MILASRRRKLISGQSLINHSTRLGTSYAVHIHEFGDSILQGESFALRKSRQRSKVSRLTKCVSKSTIFSNVDIDLSSVSIIVRTLGLAVLVLGQITKSRLLSASVKTARPEKNWVNVPHHQLGVQVVMGRLLGKGKIPGAQGVRGGAKVSMRRSGEIAKVEVGQGTARQASFELGLLVKCWLRLR